MRVLAIKSTSQKFLNKTKTFITFFITRVANYILSFYGKTIYKLLYLPVSLIQKRFTHITGPTTLLTNYVPQRIFLPLRSNLTYFIPFFHTPYTFLTLNWPITPSSENGWEINKWYKPPCHLWMFFFVQQVPHKKNTKNV